MIKNDVISDRIKESNAEANSVKISEDSKFTRKNFEHFCSGIEFISFRTAILFVFIYKLISFILGLLS